MATLQTETKNSLDLASRATLREQVPFTDVLQNNVHLARAIVEELSNFKDSLQTTAGGIGGGSARTGEVAFLDVSRGVSILAAADTSLASPTIKKTDLAQWSRINRSLAEAIVFEIADFADKGIDHGKLNGLADDDHAVYILADGLRALTANWNAGSFKITAETFESDVATGTAPLLVASTTKVANLNSDRVDDIEAAEFLQRDGSIPLTANWDAGSFKITAETFESDVATGTAPLLVASTTKVANLNSDRVDDIEAAEFVQRDGSIPLTANWDVGAFEVRAQTFESDVATGTAPLVIASTTKVANLNVDLLDGFGVGSSGSAIPNLSVANVWGANQAMSGAGEWQFRVTGVRVFSPGTNRLQITASSRLDMDAHMRMGDGKNIQIGTTTGTKIGVGTTSKIGLWGATPIVRPAAYTPSNVTTDRSYDANSTTLAEVADVLGTVIADLQNIGLFG